MSEDLSPYNGSAEAPAVSGQQPPEALTEPQRGKLHIAWLTYERDQARLVAAQAQYTQALQALQQSEDRWNCALQDEQVRCHAPGYSINLETGAWFLKEDTPHA